MDLILLLIEKSNGQKTYIEYDATTDFLNEYEYLSENYKLITVIFLGKLNRKINTFEELFKKING